MGSLLLERLGISRVTLCLSLIVLFIATKPVLSQDYTCSPTKLCAVGCCSTAGFCGFGPDYCAPGNCTNSCNAKSECDPAGWGPQYADSEGCPLNVCCSKAGFCGTTQDFCGNLKIPNPSCVGGTSANQRTVAYYEGWAVGRSCNAMLPEQIPLGSYTHINFAFAMIDPVTFAVSPMDPGDQELYPRLTGLKTLFPNLKVWISIGGWSMCDPEQPTATTFSDLAGSAQNQEKFFASLISFMSQYGFDGVDIDWEYPVAPERSGRPEDFENYPILLSNLRNAFTAAGKSWGLTITMPSSFWYLQNFDVVKLEPLVDWFNMMEYDLHGTWDATDTWIGPYVYAHTNLTEIDESMKLLWRNNISPSKVVLGLGFYSRTFTLADSSCDYTGCNFTGGGPAGPCTDSVGTLSYAEIEAIIAGGAKSTLDPVAAAQTLVYGDGMNWASYDDATTFKMKLDYANENCLGGTMVWAASLDDSKGSAAAALVGSAALPNNQVGLVVPGGVGECTWTGCQRTGSIGLAVVCPPGSSSAYIAMDGCPQPPMTIGSIYNQAPNARALCCPTSNVPPCQISGSNDNGICSAPRCGFGSLLVATTRYTIVPFEVCNVGQKNVCCENTKSTTAISQCVWSGTPPNCGAPSCPGGLQLLTKSITGDGGSQPCTDPNGWRGLCCPSGSSVDFDASTCAWYQNRDIFICTPGCPSGKIMLAVDSAGAGCSFGSGSFCCDPPAADLAPRGEPTSNDPQVQAFATFAGNYFKSGICSINDAEIPTRKTKRQSIPATSNPSSEQVCRYLVTLFVLYQSYRSATSPAEPFAVAWDQQRQLSNIGYPSFEALAYQVINYSPVEETQIDYCGDLICLGTDATSMLAENNDTMAALCVPCAEEQNFMKRELKPDGRDDNDLSQYLVTSMSRPGSNDEAFSKRYVDPDSWILPGSPGQGPTMIDLMNAVNNNQLRPEYFRWFRFQGSPGGIFGGNPIPNQVELEAVFLLGPNPGQLMQNLMSDTTVGAQNFVTFHIHFHPSGLAAGNHLAITQINVRHASRIQSRLGANPEPGYYAMISENSGRPIFQCAIDPCVGMNPASDTAPSDDTQGQQILRFVQIIRGWGNNARKNKIKKRTNLFFMQPPDPSAIVQVHQQAASNSNGLRYLWSGFAGDNPTANSGEDPTFASWVESRYSVGWAFDMNGNLYTPGPDLINPPTVTTGNPQNVFVHY